jgi:hypothetical protein
VAKRRIEELAERLLGGTSLNDLALEYQLNDSNLSKTLRLHSGEEWSYTLGGEVFTCRVPRLLPERTIRTVRQVLAANHTYVRCSPHKRNPEYLLSGYIFCEACGTKLTGQIDHGAREHAIRYYRHGHTYAAKHCPIRPRPHVPANAIERAVLKDLFHMVGNPAAIERAVKNAIPKTDKARRDQARLASELAKEEKKRERIVDAIGDGTLTNQVAKRKLADIDEQADYLRGKLGEIDALLARVPDADELRC